MLIYRRTSLLESDAQTVVNTVNCVGVMGKGLALAFKQREPDMFRAYKRICEAKKLEPGKLWLWHGTENWVLNFPTKVHWKNPSRLEWIDLGLQKFVQDYEKRGIREISFPRLGCGNGGLEWDDVRPVMERHLKPLPIPVYIHDYVAPIGIPEHYEGIAALLAQSTTDECSFDTFAESFRQLVSLAHDRFIDFSTGQPFSAHVDAEDSVIFELNDTSWSFELEELRNIWVALSNGLVTKKEAGWVIQAGADPLLSMISLLPQVRAVQIQRASSRHPELAVELKPSARAVMQAGASEEQLQLSWA